MEIEERPQKTTPSRFPWVKISVELVVIVVGVLLGLMANEWRESRNSREVAQNVLTSVASEMQDNHRQLVRMYQYYRGFLRSADSLASKSNIRLDQTPANVVPGWRGAMPPLLRSSSYDMLIHSGIIKDVPFDTADDLARIYNLQAMLKTFDQTFISKFSMDPETFSITGVRHSFHLYYEIIPSVLGYYQHFGKRHLEEFGYNLDIDDEELQEQIRRQMGF